MSNTCMWRLVNSEVYVWATDCGHQYYFDVPPDGASCCWCGKELLLTHNTYQVRLSCNDYVSRIDPTTATSDYTVEHLRIEDETL